MQSDFEKHKRWTLTPYQDKDSKTTYYFEVFTSTHCPSCSAWKGFNEMVTSGWHTLQQSSPSGFPWDRTITFRFGEAYLFSTVHCKQTAAVVTDDIWWQVSTSDKGIKSMFLIDSIEQKQSLPCISLLNSSKNTQACILHTVRSLFLMWASAVSGRQGCHDGGVVIVVPIWPHNEFRARHGVTNRTVSYSASYGKVGAEQTAVQPCLLKCLLL